MTVLAVFRSRAQTLDFATRLHTEGFFVQTVNTPAELGIGCGLSVKLDSRFLPQAKNLLRLGNYSAFAGLFGMRTSYGRTDFVRL